MGTRVPQAFSQLHHIHRRPFLSLGVTDIRKPILLQQRRSNSDVSHPPSLLDPFLSVSYDVFETVHSATGLPWAAAIPLAAVVFRTVLVLPMTIYSRHAVRNHRRIIPLMHAWRRQIERKSLAVAGHLGPREASVLKNKVISKKMAELTRRWNCGLGSRVLPFAQVPIFLVILETLRRMCGMQEGLLALLTRHIGQIYPIPTEASRQEVLSQMEPTSDSSFSILWDEPSLAYEGALWFPNLLAPDPQLILPFALSAVLLQTVYRHSRRTPDHNKTTHIDRLAGVKTQPVPGGAKARGLKPGVFQRFHLRTMGILALAAGPATLQVPSALLLFWISNSLIAQVHVAMVDKAMPLPDFEPKPYLEARKKAEES